MKNASHAILVLWRHCQAEMGLNDLERELTPKGFADAHAVASWLSPQLPQKTSLLISPAKRTQQTARALLEILPAPHKTLANIGPDLPFTLFLDAVRADDIELDGRALVVIGHQPTLGWAASRWLKEGERSAEIGSFTPGTAMLMRIFKTDRGERYYEQIATKVP